MAMVIPDFFLRRSASNERKTIFTVELIRKLSDKKQRGRIKYMRDKLQKSPARQFQRVVSNIVFERPQ